MLGLFAKRSKPDPEIVRLAEYYDPHILKRLGSGKQAALTAEMAASGYLRIAQDSAQLVNTTVKPDVFFGRYDTLESVLACLVLTEPYVKFSGTQPTAQLRQVQNQRHQAERAFIQRSYDRMIQEARALKTPKGQSNKLQRYFSVMEAKAGLMDEENVAFLRSLKERHIAR